MKKFVSGLMLLFVFFLTGCNKSGDSPTSPSSTTSGTPTISITSLSPTSSPANTSGSLKASFSFTDTDSDLGGGSAVMTYDGSICVSATLNSTYNISSGTASATCSGNTGSVGSKQVCVQLTDKAGHVSNNGCASFNVY